MDTASNELAEAIKQRIQQAGDELIAQLKTKTPFFYHTYVEDGFPPSARPGTIVKGSVVHPVEEENRLIGESNKDA